MATFYEKMKLLKGLLSGDVAYTGPFFVNVDLTSRCNLQCIGCRFHSPLLNEPSPRDICDIEDMPLSFFERLCKELKTIGTKSITLTGEGEPFLHPFLSDIISEAKRGGFHVTLVTNGTLLNKSIIEHLINSRLDILKVSLWAGTPREYEKNYPETKLIFLSKVTKGLKLLADLKTEQNSKFPFVVLHYPINRYNYKTIDAMVDLAHATGSNALSFSPFKTFRGKFDSLALTQDDEKIVRNSLLKINERSNSLSVKYNIKEVIQRYDIGADVWQKLPCYIAWLHARVLVDGTVFACHRSNLSMGNLNENSLYEIWNGSAYRKFRRKATNLKGLASLSENCDCNFCGFIINNVDIHKLFKWFSPFVHKFKN